MSDKYIVITQHAWCNDSGCGIYYDSSLEFHNTRDAAVNAGWAYQGSDDFNVGVIHNGRLVSLDGTEVIGVEIGPYVLGRIAQEIGFEGGDHV